MSAPSSRFALLALSAAYFVFGVGSLAVVGLVDPMAEQWHVSRSAVAQLVTVFALTFAVLAPVVQVLAGRLAQRTLLVMGLLVLALGLLGTGLAPTLRTAMAFRVLAALGACGVGPVASALALTLVPPERQVKALSTVFAGMTIATVIGVPLSSWLAHLVAWPLVFVCLALAAGGCAVAVALTVKGTGRAASIRLQDLIDLARRPAVLCALGVTLAQMAAQFATYALIAVVLGERFAASSSQIAAGLMVFGVGGVVANASVGRICDRFSVDAVIRASLFSLAAVFFALLAAPAQIPVAFALLAAWAMTGTVFMVPQQKRLIALAPRQRALMLAMNTSALYAGMSLGTAVGSAAHNVGGVRWMPLASVALVAVATLCHLLSARFARREAPQTEQATAAGSPFIHQPKRTP